VQPFELNTSIRAIGPMPAQQIFTSIYSPSPADAHIFNRGWLRARSMFGIGTVLNYAAQSIEAHPEPARIPTEGTSVVVALNASAT
jgi:hypothetical protein